MSELSGTKNDNNVSGLEDTAASTGEAGQIRSDGEALDRPNQRIATLRWKNASTS